MNSDDFEAKRKHLEILLSLARGIDPKTGEQSDSISLNDPSVIRALCAGASALRQECMVIAADVPLENAGKTWTSSEDIALLEAYENGEPIDMLALDFGRSINAIYLRLDKLLNKPDSKTIKEAMQNRKIR